MLCLLDFYDISMGFAMGVLLDSFGISTVCL